ncbi:SNARE associated Golgi protein [Spatholobus suberectus]|nr:SNARE associated Golgi protein [Spatholobus suberectus]
MRTLSMPCLSSSLHTHSHTCHYHCRFSPPSSFIFTPHRRSHFLTPCSSLRQRERESKKQLGKINTAPSESGSGLKRLFSPKSDGDGDGDKDKTDSDLDFQDGTALKGTLLAGVLLVGIVGGFASVGYIYKDQINSFLNQFSVFIEGYGPAGYALFVAVYAGLEILAIPAIPLTMSAGLLFGSIIGTIIVSISGTVAASVAFLIARYFARERIVKLVEGNKKFLAIDKAIGENGFRVVTLLRLSPLLPFSLGNYLYGLTSVKFIPYVLGSWLGMLPGTWAYVSAGAFGRAIIVSLYLVFFVLLVIQSLLGFFLAFISFMFLFSSFHPFLSLFCGRVMRW